MRFVSFDPLRTLLIPDATYLKPEHAFGARDMLERAEWLLFPPYWLVNPLIYGLGTPIFPSPASYHLGHDKIEMSRALGMCFTSNVPLTHILPNTNTGRDQVLATMTFPFVAKEVRNSMGRGVYLIETPAHFREYCRSVAVLYVQEFLPINRDLRIVLVGKKVVAAYWRTGDGFHNNLSLGGRVDFDDIPQQAITLVEAIGHRLNINHAGFDIAVVDGHCYVLEFNIFFGNQALNERGIRIEPYILQYLEERPDTYPRGIAA